ncbi:hemicentin-1 [Hydra vulgaris]|uniref:hemicentin-1 n=1 Tax=Hydra vulgaris TaxID=6087 RepID=UPI001F5E9E6D|nr:hemicentin-1 [Hydra vulgaris]
MLFFILIALVSNVLSITKVVNIDLNSEKEVLLICLTKNKEDFVTWYKKNSKTKTFDELGFSETVFFPDLNSIQLKDVEKEDLGVYVCKDPLTGVTFTTFELVEKNITQVTKVTIEPPSPPLQWVLLPNSENTITNGRLHVFACRASGGKVNVEAFRLNKNGSIREKLRQGGVVLHNPSEHDTGKYLCVANNSAASIKHEFSIFVIVHGGISEWSHWSLCDQNCGFGTQIRTRNCTNPKPANGGMPCSEESLQRRQCKSRSCSAPKLTKFGFDLTDDNNLKLDCFATGIPTPKIVWKYDGDDLPKQYGSEETRLIIPKTKARSGEYSCTVENPAGYFTMYINVDL